MGYAEIHQVPRREGALVELTDAHMVSIRYCDFRLVLTEYEAEDLAEAIFSAIKNKPALTRS